jgi:hypothetical protein
MKSNTKHYQAHEEPKPENILPEEVPEPAVERKPARRLSPGAPRTRRIARARRGSWAFQKTPGHVLRWVRLDAVDRRKNQGYVLATPEEFDSTPDENGMIRRNELVLMLVPDHVYQKRRLEVAALTKQQSQAPSKSIIRARAQASRQSGHNLSDDNRDEE